MYHLTTSPYLQRFDHAHGARGDVVEVVANALVKARALDGCERRGDPDALAKDVYCLWGKPSPLERGQRVEAGVVPSLDNILLWCAHNNTMLKERRDVCIKRSNDVDRTFFSRLVADSFYVNKKPRPIGKQCPNISLASLTYHADSTRHKHVPRTLGYSLICDPVGLHSYILMRRRILRLDSTVPVKLRREYSHCTGQYRSSALQSLEEESGHCLEIMGFKLTGKHPPSSRVTSKRQNLLGKRLRHA